MTLEILYRIEIGINKGEFVESARMLKLTARDGESERSFYADFLEARIDHMQGRVTEARNKYRAILAKRPNFARVRLHLANSLKETQDFDSSKHHYQLVLGAATDKSSIDQIRANMSEAEKGKRWTVQTSFSLAPSSNLNNGTGSDIVYINGIPFSPDTSMRKKQGISALYGLEASYLQPLKEDVSLLFSGYSFHSDKEGRAYDDRNIGFGFGPQFRFSSGILTAEAITSRQWFGNNPSMYSYGGRLTVRYLLNHKMSLTTQATLTQQRYDVMNYQDGIKYTQNSYLDYTLNSSQFLRFGGSFEQDNTKSAHLAYQEVGVNLGYYMELPHGITFFPEISLAKRQYKADYPFMGGARKDTRAKASINLTKRDLVIFGLAPRATYSFTRNISNVGFYDFSKHDFNVNFVKTF